MSTPQRIVAFLAALVLTFAVGYGIGAAVDPVLDQQDAPAADHGRQDPPAGHDQHQEDGS